MNATVVSVHANTGHHFSKQQVNKIELQAGLGVIGDAHCGAQVKHRSRVRADPTQPNLRQVHLIHSELFERMADQGFSVTAGDIGENITTVGIDLLALPIGAVLGIGSDVLIALTGLRNPCGQIDNFQDGLLNTVRNKDAHGAIVRLAGVMGVVVHGGTIEPGAAVEVALPPGEPRPLQPV